MHPRTAIVVALAVAGWLLTAGPGLGAAPRQGLIGVQANWKDLETWSRVIDSSKENELGLGLQPAGGAVIAFLGRLSIRDPRMPPADVRAHIAPAFMAKPNLIRTPSLTFVADAGTTRRIAFDVSAGLITDGPSPGGIIQNAMGTLRTADFLRLSQSETLSGNILGFDVVFRPDQLRAMRAFAKRLNITGRESREARAPEAAIAR